MLEEPTYSRLIRLLEEDGEYAESRGPVAVLEIELTEENDRVFIPPFIEVIKEVTGDSRYSMKSLAKKRN
ncbi:MAG: hypothetical protein UX72_C0011G0002 [Parcubacteria group bacterium GW2011_GWA2_47_10]|nr:MAG: hypothetical protein UX72_C0011G0002 [Parcubacteria group bacterium GW2011_GWA2_47_10]